MLAIFGLDGMEAFFAACAVLGGALFLVRLAMMFTGGHEGDLGDPHPDSDLGFKFLSLQALTAFFMMFGLVGFALIRRNQAGESVAVAGAVGAGLATMWVMSKIFRSMRRLESSGTIEAGAAVGATGTVYLTIPADGTGQVQVTVRGNLCHYDARAKDPVELKTGVPIRVCEVIAGNVLVVEKG